MLDRILSDGLHRFAPPKLRRCAAVNQKIAAGDISAIEHRFRQGCHFVGRAASQRAVKFSGIFANYLQNPTACIFTSI
ncbi:MAG: hypothetical protein ACTTIY_06025 [Haemophilus parainfluenzae]|jgi:hypothetical protein